MPVKKGKGRKGPTEKDHITVPKKKGLKKGCQTFFWGGSPSVGESYIQLRWIKKKHEGPANVFKGEGARKERTKASKKKTKT